MDRDERLPVMSALILVTVLMAIYFGLEVSLLASVAPILAAVVIAVFFWTQPLRLWTIQKIFFVSLFEVIISITILWTGAVMI